MKIKIYETVVFSVLLYGAETWTSNSLTQKLDSFDEKIKCLRKIEGIKCFYYVYNAQAEKRTNTQPVRNKIAKRKTSFLRHLTRSTPPPETVELITDTPNRTWKCPRGRPHKKWEDNIFTTLDGVGVDKSKWRMLAYNRTFWRHVVHSRYASQSDASG